MKPPRITWSKPNGDWGISDIDWNSLPPAVYGGLFKLKKIEDLIEQLHNPKTPIWMAEQILQELLGATVALKIKSVQFGHLN